jgi:hypothetical protein
MRFVEDRRPDGGQFHQVDIDAPTRRGHDVRPSSDCGSDAAGGGLAMVV